MPARTPIERSPARAGLKAARVLDESRRDAAQSAARCLATIPEVGFDMRPWLILLVLVILHHDFWFWNDSSLLGDWLPIGLAWHIGLSIVAAAFWLFAVKTAWPVEEAPEPGTDAASESAAGGDQP